MMNYFAGRVLIILFFLLFFQSGSFSIGANTREHPDQLDSTTSAQLSTLLAELKDVELATDAAQRAVESFADSTFLPQLLFQLSEWELRREKLKYNIDLEKYDVYFRRFERDSMKYPEPEEPRLTYQTVLHLNRRLIDEFPDLPFLDKIKYRMGVCLFEIGKRDSAKLVFIGLVNDHPDSSYIPELLFRIGECNFDGDQFHEALRYYNQIIDRHPDTSFFGLALYKRAWCYYRLNDYSEALSTFFYLLSDIKLIESIDCELLGKSQTELVNETVEYIAISFSDYGGTSEFLDFVNSMGNFDYTHRVLQKMAEIYYQRNFYEEAITADEKILELFPLIESAPQAQFNLFECFEKMGDYNKAFMIRTLFMKLYGPGSRWAQINETKARREQIDSLLQSIDFIIATPYLSRADSLFKAEKFTLSTEVYKNFLKTYLKDERSPHAAYYLAESFYALADLKNAAIAYRYVATGFPDSDLAEDAAYNRVVCYDQLMSQAADNEGDTLIWRQNNRMYLIRLDSESQKKFILACRDFMKWYPGSIKNFELKLKLADIFIRQEQNTLAENILNPVLLAIIKHRQGVQYFIKALEMMGYVKFKQGEYFDAEKYYTYLIKQNPDSTQLVEKSKTMLASTSFKIAEQLKIQGDNFQAAARFEKTAAESREAQVAEAALFEAAIQYETAGKIERAAINFEKFCTKFPNSQNIEQALYHAATDREKLSQWYFAAKNYLALYHRNPNSAQGASALFAAGIMYENTKDWNQVVGIFNEYLKTFLGEENQLWEAMFKTGYAHEQMGHILKAYGFYQQIIDKHQMLVQKGAVADDYIAAQTRFRMGEMRHMEFVKIELKPPFEKNLKLKQNAFNEMLKQLVEVARYNVAEWTTAAFYRIGNVYEEFCQDILKSPSPPNLSKEELKNYWYVIRQDWILPLQAEALKYYQTNEKLALENKVDNEWVRKTRDRARFLKGELTASQRLREDNLKQAIDVDNIKFKADKRNL